MASARLLATRYELEAILGRGGMADVWRGNDRRLGRTVAVKILHADLARDPEFRARFHREAESVASLAHPSIVAVYDTGVEHVDGGSVPFIVMEHVDGTTLRDICNDGRLPAEEALAITAEVLDALAYSHRHGIVHRDVKPSNIMVTPSGGLRVMDFGIARVLADMSANLTSSAAVIGTAQYLSPEQARGGRIDARSDVYSTGCMLYELLTGQPPFVGDSPIAVACAQVQDEPVPASVLDPSVLPEHSAIAMRAVEKDPARRYQSAAEMRDALRAVLSGEQVETGEQVGIGELLATYEDAPAGVALGSPDLALAPGVLQLPRAATRRRTYALFSVAVAVVIAMAALGFTRLGGELPPASGESPPMRQSGKATSSPDGRHHATSTPTDRSTGNARTVERQRPPTPSDRRTATATPGQDDADGAAAKTTPPTQSPRPTPSDNSPGPSRSPEPSDSPSPTPGPSETPTTPPPNAD